ncbi:MAG: hypothetical protein HC892_21925 [Saprospiraceae bacterium]|nr:hypothetical protein [Saprospiraceae bacterium]
MKKIGVIELEEKYFNQVWYYYKYEPKRFLFEFIEKIFIHFISLTTQKDIEATSLNQLLKNHPLEEDFKYLKDKELWEMRIKEFYQVNRDKSLSSSAYSEKKENLVELYNETYKVLTQDFTNPNQYFNTLRTNFMQLLNAMPESIYD